MGTEKVWTVEDVMIEDVVSVTPSTSFKHMVDLLWVNDVSSLPVVDDAGKLVGIVTESDLLSRTEFRPGTGHPGSSRSRLVEKLETASPLTAADVMSQPVLTVEPSATLADAARLMKARRVRRLPVVDPVGAVVGMVSQVDLLKVFFRSEETIQWDAQDVVTRRLGAGQKVEVKVVDAVVHLTGLPAGSEQADAVVSAIDSLPRVVGVEID
jgi:CBS-domain-containing membrane protein